MRSVLTRASRPLSRRDGRPGRDAPPRLPTRLRDQQAGGVHASRCCGSIGLAPYLDLVLAATACRARSPIRLPLLHCAAGASASARRLLMIGDSANDCLAARAAGCPVFCVPYGYRGTLGVHELDCDAIVPALPKLNGTDRTSAVMNSSKLGKPEAGKSGRLALVAPVRVLAPHLSVAVSRLVVFRSFRSSS